MTQHLQTDQDESSQKMADIEELRVGESAMIAGYFFASFTFK